jgi:hypothetical protein
MDKESGIDTNAPYLSKVPAGTNFRHNVNKKFSKVGKPDKEKQVVRPVGYWDKEGQLEEVLFTSDLEGNSWIPILKEIGKGIKKRKISWADTMVLIDTDGAAFSSDSNHGRYVRMDEEQAECLNTISTAGGKIFFLTTRATKDDWKLRDAMEVYESTSRFKIGWNESNSDEKNLDDLARTSAEGTGGIMYDKGIVYHSEEAEKYNMRLVHKYEAEFLLRCEGSENRRYVIVVSSHSAFLRSVKEGVEGVWNENEQGKNNSVFTVLFRTKSFHADTSELLDLDRQRGRTVYGTLEPTATNEQGADAFCSPGSDIKEVVAYEDKTRQLRTEVLNIFRSDIISNSWPLVMAEVENPLGRSRTASETVTGSTIVILEWDSLIKTVTGGTVTLLPGVGDWLKYITSKRGRYFFVTYGDIRDHGKRMDAIRKIDNDVAGTNSRNIIAENDMRLRIDTLWRNVHIEKPNIGLTSSQLSLETSSNFKPSSAAPQTLMDNITENTNNLDSFEGIIYKDSFLYCVEREGERDRFRLMNEYAVRELLKSIIKRDGNRFDRAVIVSRTVLGLRSFRDGLTRSGVKDIRCDRIFSVLFGDKWAEYTGEKGEKGNEIEKEEWSGKIDKEKEKEIEKEEWSGEKDKEKETNTAGNKPRIRIKFRVGGSDKENNRTQSKNGWYKRYNDTNIADYVIADDNSESESASDFDPQAEKEWEKKYENTNISGMYKEITTKENQARKEWEKMYNDTNTKSGRSSDFKPQPKNKRYNINLEFANDIESESASDTESGYRGKNLKENEGKHKRKHGRSERERYGDRSNHEKDDGKGTKKKKYLEEGE